MVDLCSSGTLHLFIGMSLYTPSYEINIFPMLLHHSLCYRGGTIMPFYNTDVPCTSSSWGYFSSSLSVGVEALPSLSSTLRNFRLRVTFGLL
jgi:hypothetical protein